MQGYWGDVCELWVGKIKLKIKINVGVCVLSLSLAGNRGSSASSALSAKASQHFGWVGSAVCEIKHKINLVFILVL